MKRKLDELGRITIPASLREKYKLTKSSEVAVNDLGNGRIEIVCGGNEDEELRIAREVLKRFGYDIPEELNS